MPTIAEGKRLVIKRQRWLKKKNLTLGEFSDAVGIDYNSCYKWMTQPRRLHRLYAERVREKYRDFPLKAK